MPSDDIEMRDQVSFPKGYLNTHTHLLIHSFIHSLYRLLIRYLVWLIPMV